MDCLFCCDAAVIQNFTSQHQEQEQERKNDKSSKIMKWYVNKLMQPKVQWTVFSSFALFFCFALYRASLMDQQFDTTTMLPRTSSVRGFLSAADTYSTRLVG